MSKPHSTKTDLIPAHGGYRQLKSFQSAELAYDATVKFCDRFIDIRLSHSRSNGPGRA
jgi:hypothetical protein